jgi:hypothetical protein
MPKNSKARPAGKAGFQVIGISRWAHTASTIMFLYMPLVQFYVGRCSSYFSEILSKSFEPFSKKSPFCVVGPI